MSSCAIETCERSAQRGGPGCHMCDYVAMLPQQRKQDGQAGKVKDHGTSDEARREDELMNKGHAPLSSASSGTGHWGSY